MNTPVNAPANAPLLQGATLSNFKPGIGQMMLGINQQPLGDYQAILQQIMQNKANFYNE
jgi:hypothetical protein